MTWCTVSTRGRAGTTHLRVVGRRGDLYVRIGGEDAQWQPANSNYQNYREYAQGVGWEVWVGIPSNPDLQQAPLKGALPVPDYREPGTIEVPDGLLN